MLVDVVLRPCVLEALAICIFSKPVSDPDLVGDATSEEVGCACFSSSVDIVVVFDRTVIVIVVDLPGEAALEVAGGGTAFSAVVVSVGCAVGWGGGTAGRKNAIVVAAAEVVVLVGCVV